MLLLAVSARGRGLGRVRLDGRVARLDRLPRDRRARRSRSSVLTRAAAPADAPRRCRSWRCCCRSARSPSGRRSTTSRSPARARRAGARASVRARGCRARPREPALHAGPGDGTRALIARLASRRRTRGRRSSVMSYAIVKVGGKQYRVEEGDSIVVDRMSAERGRQGRPRAAAVRRRRQVGARRATSSRRSRSRPRSPATSAARRSTG